MDANAAKPPRKRKRRWFQFSLRTLMIFTLLCAVGCGFLMRRIQRKRTEREAVAAIEKDRGRVWFDYQIDVSPTPPGPAWLRNLLGDDFGAEVVAVRLDGWKDQSAVIVGDHWETPGDGLFPATDERLSRLANFTELTSLDLGNTDVTDAGLRRFKNLRRLQFVSVRNTRVTAAGIAEFQQALPDCKITR